MSEAGSDRLAVKANELYWRTSRPAGRLADELGISRSKFYGLIDPLPVDLTCEACGAPLTFNSRTDREAGRGRCSRCGRVTDIEPGVLAEEVAMGSELDRNPSHRAAPGGAYGARELWLTAVVGVATGMAIAAWWRRR